MTTEKIKRLADVLRSEHKDLVFVEKEVTDLLLAIADLIIGPQEKPKEEGVPFHYVLVTNFVEDNCYIGYSTVFDYCKNHPELSKHARFYDRRWYVDPVAAHKFFSSFPLYKKRIRNLEKLQQKMVSCNK